MNTDPNVTTVVVPVGALGAGIRAEHLEAGLSAGAHAMAMDAGSTDSGPSYLATGRSKYSRAAVMRDLRVLMTAQKQWPVPILIGSCGTSGGDIALDWTRDIVLELAEELGVSPRIALLYSEQDPTVIKARNGEGRIRPLEPLGPLDDATTDRCEHIVALMGPEPYIAALEAGADIILGGRTTDTAVIAAVPLMRGAGAGPAWHAGKVSECGGLCTESPTDGGVLIRVGIDAFEVTPLSATNRCTPYSVSAHMLYENSDHQRIYEPGGVLDVSDARHQAIDDRTVRVTGSRFIPAPYTMKLEGATKGPFQTLMLVGITDPQVLESIEVFLDRMQSALIERTRSVLGLDEADFDISLRPYGFNAVSGLPRPDRRPMEVGLLFVATAATQALATDIAKTANPYFFHMPLKLGKELPSYGFAFSPAEMERGQTYEFLLNHVVETTDGHELVRRVMLEVAGQDGEAAHA